MTEDFEFEIWQDGLPVAETAGRDRATALREAMREAMHYMAVYGQDGPVKLFEVTRRQVFHDQ